jgi:tyrosyl-tRNA synthetase
MAPQVVLTLPLLEGLDGVEKMSKSLGNYVAIDEPPEQQFGKLMSIPDRLVGRYATLCTDLGPVRAAELAEAAEAGGPSAGAAKRALAREIVTLYQGADAADAAEAHFNLVVRDHAVPQDAPDHPLPAGDPVHLPAVLVAAGLAGSTSQARRAIDEGSVRVAGTPLASGSYDVARAEVVGQVVQVGRRRYARLVESPG